MKRAITETVRRRQYQKKYNKEHHIIPKSIKKAIKESRLAGAKAEATAVEPQLRLGDIPQEELPHIITDLKNQMAMAAQNLEFEKAAMLRDQIQELKKVKRKH